jgi:hypothetical protein
MADALEAADGQRYARALLDNPLYLPTVPEDADWPEGLARIDEGHVLIFTSPVTLFRGLAGYARGYEELTFEQLRERWPDPDAELIVNAGAPIGVFLTMGQVTALADGTESLVSTQDLQDAMIDGVVDEVRRICLAELDGDAAVATEVLSEVETNELEGALLRAVEDSDFDGFLLALLNADVVVLTTEAVADPAYIKNVAFPWRVLGDDESPVVPVFSSAEVLDRIVPGGPHRVRVPFLDLLVAWPSDEHIMCFNPGTSAELTLPAGGVPELAAVVAAAADE